MTFRGSIPCGVPLAPHAETLVPQPLTSIAPSTSFQQGKQHCKAHLLCLAAVLVFLVLVSAERERKRERETKSERGCEFTGRNPVFSFLIFDERFFNLLVISMYYPVICGDVSRLRYFFQAFERENPQRRRRIALVYSRLVLLCIRHILDNDIKKKVPPCLGINISQLFLSSLTS